MSALDRLKEKVEVWKKRIEELEEENRHLKARLDRDLDDEGTVDDVLLAELEECQSTVADLQEDIAVKDQEIEAIIAKVEALIDQ